MDPTEAGAAATGAIERAAAPADTPPVPDLEDSSLYFNRELSWLDFNDRVLQLAEDLLRLPGGLRNGAHLHHSG